MVLRRSPRSLVAAATMLVAMPACRASRDRATLEGFNAGLASLADEPAGPTVPSRQAAEQLLASDANSLTDMIAASTKALDDLFETDLGHLLAESDAQIAHRAPFDPESPRLEPAPDSAGLATLADAIPLDEPQPLPEVGPQLSELARDIADALVAGLGYSQRPIEDALALLGLDSLVPGAANAPLESDALSPVERAQIESARTLMDAIRSGSDDPDAAADAAEQIALELADQMPLRLDRAELCSRVDGFGQYTQFRGNTFIAGRSHRVIVYVELSRFGHTEVPGADAQPRYAVDLTQRIEIYHEPDGVLAMATPTLADRRVSRNRFRDYYVVTAIDLPETLSVGKYGIRITMRDRSDDSLAEVVIPLTMVADASALEPQAP